MLIMYCLDQTFHLLQVDVYVNTAASSLNLRLGAVANSLRNSGGPKLQEECTQYTQAKGDVKVWEFATTRGHKLKCKHVIHTVGAEYDGQGGRAEQVRFSIIESSGVIISVSVHSMKQIPLLFEALYIGYNKCSPLCSFVEHGDYGPQTDGGV